MGMGWNLLGGALAGLGNGMVQNADAEQKRVAAEALAMKEQAMARLTSDLSMQRNEADYRMKAPEREFNQELAAKKFDQDKTYQDAIIADKGVQRTLTEERNKALKERDEAIAAAKAMAAGGKPGKLDQTLTDADKNFDQNFYKQLEKIQDPIAGGKPEEIAAKVAQLEKQRFARFGLRTEIDEGGGVTLTDRTGYTKRFSSPEEAAAAGFKTKTVADAIAQKSEPVGPPKELANPRATQASSGGVDSMTLNAVRAKAAMGGKMSPAEQQILDAADKVKAAKDAAQQEEWRKKQAAFESNQPKYSNFNLLNLADHFGRQ